MASFVASRTSRAARAARFSRQEDSHTPKALQAEMAALKKATLADAGPILLRLLQSFEFREYAMANDVLPAGVRDCVYTYMYNGVFIVDTPTRPTSPITPDSSATTTGGSDGSNLLVREGPEGSSPSSTHSNLLGLEAPDMDVDVLACLKGLAIVESVVGRVSDPMPLMRFSAAAASSNE